MSRAVTVIGGGASGLLAAIAAARAGAKVTVLEHNERPGRKLLATGNGKCNLTNLDADLSHYHTDEPARVSAVLDRFGNAETQAFFQDLGLLLTSRDGWVYPVTGQAATVLDLLLLEADRLGVKRKNSEDVTGIEATESGFVVRTKTWQYEADAVVVATGSPASAVRGASSDALAFAKELGIEACSFLPALTALVTDDRGRASWAGVRAHARAELMIDGTFVAADTGEVQFTAQGISGIPVMQLSHAAVRALEEGRDVSVILDLAPEYTDDEFADLVEKIRLTQPEKTEEQLKLGFFPKKLIPLLPEGKRLEVSVRAAADLSQAQICQGGVRLSALTDSLESRAVPGLFFAGECVDVHGDCGGYNLQWAWSSGYVAGSAAGGAK